VTTTLPVQLTFRSSDGHLWEIDEVRGRLRGSRPAAGRRYEADHDFAAPLGDEALRYLRLAGPAMPANTIDMAATGIGSFCRFLGSTGRAGFSPQAFSAFVAWMQDQGWEETSRRGWATVVRVWIRNSLRARQLATDADVLSVDRRFRRHFRGFTKRRADALRETWLGPAEHVRLLRAIRMEIEACRALLRAPASEQAAYTHHALPLAPFFQLLGLLLGVRSAELNVATWGDLREHDGRLWLHVHAPNKEPGRLFLTDTVLEAWEVAREWMARYRPDPQPGDPLLAVLHPDSGEVARLDTFWTRHVLHVFYRKYFRRRDRDGRPVLYRGTDEAPRLFDLSFVNYRVAAISEHARKERNPLHLKRFARHRDVSTTLLYYARQAHLEWLADVAKAHEASVEIARITQRGSVATPDEVRRAEACQACVLDGAGICGEGLVGVHRCEKAADCRVCSSFKLNPDRREYFVVDLERNEARALDAATQGLKRDAQVYEALCALDRACIARIDDYYDEPVALWGDA